MKGDISPRMTTLMEVARLINSSRVLEEVLRLTLEWSTRVMEAEAGSGRPGSGPWTCA